MTSNRRSGISLIETLVIVGIIVVVNVLGYHMFQRLDLTEDQRYTVSPVTRKILRELQDPVSVEFFMSSDLPPQMIRIRDDVRDMLQEYDVYGGTNFRVRYTDPGDDLEKQSRAEGLGVRKFQLQVIEGERASVQEVFFGLVMNYRDRSEAMSQIIDPTMLEYDLTSRLLRLTMREKPKIAWFAGSMNINEQQGPSFEGVKQVLGGPEGLYELVELDPANDQMLPEGVSAVFLFGAFGLSDNLKYSIDQYLMNGGDVFLSFDPMMQTGQQQGGMGDAFPSLPTIEDQLEAYGLTVNKKLVVDMASHAQAQFQTGMFRLAMPYPLWPRIGPEGTSDEVGALAKLAPVLPWSAPMSDVERPGVTFTPLFHTTADAFLLNSPFKLDPQQSWDFLASTSPERGPFRLGYLLTGTIPSAFPEGPPAAQPGADGTMELSPFDNSKHVAEAASGARLIAVSTASGFSDNFLSQFRDNALLLMNLGDMLALPEDLSSIRAQAVNERLLRPLNDSQKSFVRWASVVTLPLIVVLIGVGVYFARQRRRHAIMRRYGISGQ